MNTKKHHTSIYLPETKTKTISISNPQINFPQLGDIVLRINILRTQILIEIWSATKTYTQNEFSAENKKWQMQVRTPKISFNKTAPWSSWGTAHLQQKPTSRKPLLLQLH